MLSFLSNETTIVAVIAVTKLTTITTTTTTNTVIINNALFQRFSNCVDFDCFL